MLESNVSKCLGECDVILECYCNVETVDVCEYFCSVVVDCFRAVYFIE